MCRAIRESLSTSGGETSDVGPRRKENPNRNSYDEQIQIALAMSEQDMMSKTQEDRNEDDELQRILKLSLTEK